MKPALLVIDVQKQYYSISETTKRSLEDSMPYINAAIDLFRSKNLPIICIQHLDERNNFTPECDGFQSPETLKIEKSDIHIHKTKSNGFIKTNLLDELHKLNVDTVILTGLAAEYCVLSTYRGAADNDIAPIVLRNALSSMNPENIKFVENIGNLISFGALTKFIENF